MQDSCGQQRSLDDTGELRFKSLRRAIGLGRNRAMGLSWGPYGVHQIEAGSLGGTAAEAQSARVEAQIHC